MGNIHADGTAEAIKRLIAQLEDYDLENAHHCIKSIIEKLVAIDSDHHESTAKVVQILRSSLRKIGRHSPLTARAKLLEALRILNEKRDPA